MRPRLPELLSGQRASDVLVVVAAAAALLGAVWGARLSLDRMEFALDTYPPLTQLEREQEIERSLGFDPGLWRAIGASVEDDDRFFVVSDAPEQHEVRNYAKYLLLPAIEVPDADDATVVLYWKARPPGGSACRELEDGVCLERRGRA